VSWWTDTRRSWWYADRPYARDRQGTHATPVETGEPVHPEVLAWVPLPRREDRKSVKQGTWADSTKTGGVQAGPRLSFACLCRATFPDTDTGDESRLNAQIRCGSRTRLSAMASSAASPPELRRALRFVRHDVVSREGAEAA
jgi:hypothetical protein